MIYAAEALELEIESAWMRLGPRPVTLYLSALGRITTRSSGSEIGTYTGTVRLSDFRDDVFDVFDKVRHERS